MPGELFFEGPVSNWFTAPIGLSFPLQLREARWMRSPRGVQDTLERLDGERRRAALLRGRPDHARDRVRRAPPAAARRGARRGARLRARRGPQRAAGGRRTCTASRSRSARWVTGTEYAPDFFAEVGWDHRRSEMFIAPPALPRAGAPDSPQADAADPRLRASTPTSGTGRWSTRSAGPTCATSSCALHLHDGLFRSVGGGADHERARLRGRAAVPLRRLRAARAGRAGPRGRRVDARRKGLYSTAPACPAFSADERVPRLPRTRAAGTARSGTTRPRGCCTRSARSPRAPSEAPLRERFARAWTQWTASHLALGYPMVVEHFHPETGRPYRLIPDYFHSAWLDTFFRHVVDRRRWSTSARCCSRASRGRRGDQLGARRAWRAWMSAAEAEEVVRAADDRDRHRHPDERVDPRRASPRPGSARAPSRPARPS